MSGQPPTRAIGALDLDLAASIHRRCFEAMGERGWTRQDFGELLAAPGVAGWLQDDLGVALCRFAADEAELLTIAVLPEHRRAGAGRRLLDTVIEWARSAGARALFLEVGADNPAARALYDRAGFEVVGGRRGYYARGGAPPADAVVMRLALKRACVKNA
jgi:[ribosomal protein S18]-alanine N-acetyltransferase